MRRPPAVRALAVLGVCVFAGLAPAQALDTAGLLPDLQRDGFDRRFDIVRPSAPGPAGAGVDTTFKPVPGGSGTAAALAQAYPPAARGEVQRVFRQLLEAVPKLEGRYRLPHNDLAVAVAVFLDGACAGYAGRVTPESDFIALVAQMRALLSARPAIAAAPDAEKQAVFEQLMILGLLTEGTQHALDRDPKAPNAAQARANLRQASKGYLEGFLGIDADQVRLGPQGLVLAAADRQPPQAQGAAPVPTAAAERIESVLLKQGYSMGYGNATVLTYRPVVLFKDGSYTTDADGALKPQPRIDGRWRRSGGGFTLTGRDGKTATVDARMQARPAPRGAVLAGTYGSFSGVGDAALNVPVVAASKRVEFARDGSVRGEKGVGSSSATVATSGRHADTARYSLDGYTIAFTQPDGRTETRLFYFFPDSDRAIGLGGGTLSAAR